MAWTSLSFLLTQRAVFATPIRHARVLTRRHRREIDVSYERYPVIKQLPDYDFTILVKGDSMEPEIKSGDELACRVVTDASFIQWGKVHVLDTDQGIVVKRIYDDKDGLKCVSDNPKYLPFTVPKDQLRSVCLVVGLVRF